MYFYSFLFFLFSLVFLFEDPSLNHWFVTLVSSIKIVSTAVQVAASSQPPRKWLRTRDPVRTAKPAQYSSSCRTSTFGPTITFRTSCWPLSSYGNTSKFTCFVWAWNTPGKTAQSLKTPWKWLFPWKPLEFVEIVQEFYWRVLEYWNNSPINHFEREILNTLRPLKLFYLTAIQWYLLEVSE